MSEPRAAHWDDRYRTVGAEHVSWYEARPDTSLDLLDLLGTTAEDSVIDVGGGASVLVDYLLARGHHDLTVLDMSAAAIEMARHRVGHTDAVGWIATDLLTWTPERRWDVWHDRALLHFLTGEADREAYVHVVRRAVRPGGAVIIGVFAEDGPTHCSGLPVRRCSAADLRELLADLRVVHERREDHVTPEGVVQPFNWIAGRMPG